MRAKSRIVMVFFPTRVELNSIEFFNRITLFILVLDALAARMSRTVISKTAKSADFKRL